VDELGEDGRGLLVQLHDTSYCPKGQQAGTTGTAGVDPGAATRASSRVHHPQANFLTWRQLFAGQPRPSTTRSAGRTPSAAAHITGFIQGRPLTAPRGKPNVDSGRYEVAPPVTITKGDLTGTTGERGPTLIAGPLGDTAARERL